MPERVIVGTRGSKLALAQAEKVIRELKKRGYEVSIQVIKTSGDILKDKPLYEFKGSGAFVRTIDEALADEEIDIAVHSLKDVPIDRIEGTTISAVLERESPYDAFISRTGERIDDVPSGFIIGTSSIRRIAQLKRYRPDLKIKNIRGNLDTRIRKMKDGEYDGILVALAGLIRLNINIPHQILKPPLFVPSANQGIIAVAVREGEEDLVSFINHRKTYLCATAEREILKEIGVGCSVPAGIFSEISGKELSIMSEVLNTNGEEKVRLEKVYELEYENGFGECDKADVEKVRKIAREFSKELKTKMIS